jgi:hypothetical protein
MSGEADSSGVARRTGKSIGRLAGPVEQGLSLYRRGSDFIGQSSEAWLPRDALASGLAALRKGVG